MTTIACRGVRVRLGGVAVVDGVDLDVGEGEWVAVVGPNGAGKTSLLRAVAGLVAASGEIRLGGAEGPSLRRRDRARLVALVPQAPVVPPGMSTADYVLLGRVPHHGVRAAPGAADVAAARRALDGLDLGALAARPLDSLSGGERQRAFLARALAQEAPVLLLDEPTTALDVGHQMQVLELVDALRVERGLAVLSTLHDLTVAGQYAERLVLLDGGQAVASGSPAEVLTEETLARHYGASVRVVADGDGVAVLPRRAGPTPRPNLPPESSDPTNRAASSGRGGR